mmetsp:Transcript_70679/g.197469  ORF Transcript_70679/g.197469 Transcript_70679/m.197469 type:complete len:663 (+) Transcript_70679:274-2262(+)
MASYSLGSPDDQINNENHDEGWLTLGPPSVRNLQLIFGGEDWTTQGVSVTAASLVSTNDTGAVTATATATALGVVEIGSIDEIERGSSSLDVELVGLSNESSGGGGGKGKRQKPKKRRSLVDLHPDLHAGDDGLLRKPNHGEFRELVRRPSVKKIKQWHAERHDHPRRKCCIRICGGFCCCVLIFVACIAGFAKQIFGGTVYNYDINDVLNSSAFSNRNGFLFGEFDDDSGSIGRRPKNGYTDEPSAAPSSSPSAMPTVMPSTPRPTTPAPSTPSPTSPRPTSVPTSSQPSVIPTPAPTASPVTSIVANSSMVISGISASDFDDEYETAFKDATADSSDLIHSAEDITSVATTDYSSSRRLRTSRSLVSTSSVKITFTVQVYVSLELMDDNLDTGADVVAAVTADLKSATNTTKSSSTSSFINSFSKSLEDAGETVPSLAVDTEATHKLLEKLKETADMQTYSFYQAPTLTPTTSAPSITPLPSVIPTPSPTTPAPTTSPTMVPLPLPTAAPVVAPTPKPTGTPTTEPTVLPTTAMVSVSPTPCTGSTLFISGVGFKNDVGEAKLWLHNSKNQWNKDKDEWDDNNGVYYWSTEPIESKTTLFEVRSLPAGQYGVMVLHDKNMNGKMAKNFRKSRRLCVYVCVLSVCSTRRSPSSNVAVTVNE